MRGAVQWDERFTLGHEAIDAQHRELFELAQRVVEACRRPDRGVLVHELRRLTEHTAAHFLYEEACMAKSGYANTAAHTRHHREVLAKLEQFCGDLLAGRISRRGEKLTAFLSTWAALDIGAMDGELAKHLKQHRA
jgi:hemerythrin